jgi:hypothetical protein
MVERVGQEIIMVGRKRRKRGDKTVLMCIIDKGDMDRQKLTHKKYQKRCAIQQPKDDWSCQSAIR